MRLSALDPCHNSHSFFCRSTYRRGGEGRWASLKVAAYFLFAASKSDLTEEEKKFVEGMMEGMLGRGGCGSGLLKRDERTLSTRERKCGILLWLRSFQGLLLLYVLGEAGPRTKYQYIHDCISIPWWRYSLDPSVCAVILVLNTIRSRRAPTKKMEIPLTHYAGAIFHIFWG